MARALFAERLAAFHACMEDVTEEDVLRALETVADPCIHCGRPAGRPVIGDWLCLICGWGQVPTSCPLCFAPVYRNGIWGQRNHPWPPSSTTGCFRPTGAW